MSRIEHTFNSSLPTLAIYGIQDRIELDHPGYVHDHNFALFSEGRVEKFCQLERITRNKRDNRLHQSLTKTLRQEQLIGKEYDLVFVDNVVGRTFISSDGQSRFEAPLNTHLCSHAEKGKGWWYGSERNAWVVSHELAHVCTSIPFFGTPQNNTLLVHFDGGASLSNFSAWHYINNTLLPVEAHWDLKYLTTLFNANALAFAIIGAKMHDQNSVPGKMMGFASFGSYSEEMEQWLTEHSFFEDIWAKKGTFFNAARETFGWTKASFDQRDPFLQDIIATMQAIFQRDVLAKLSELQSLTGATELIYSGGCALNIVTNTEIVDSGMFENVYIPPCCEDSGLSLGAGAFVEWMKHGSVELHSAFLNNWNLKEDEVSYNSATIEAVAKDLVAGKVLATCNGYGEAGPRALGNRSIIALANSVELARKVSVDHKKREWYRPVAPIMLEENALYFTKRDRIHHLAKYMLLDYTVAKDRTAELCGAIHVDGTSRIQSLAQKEDNPFLFDLLTLLHEKYGVRALLNTSFNIQGEPIVHTTEGALSSARNLNLDGVITNGTYHQFS